MKTMTLKSDFHRKGDVYVVIAKSCDHPIAKAFAGEGFVFACRQRNRTFARPVPPESDFLRDCAVIINPKNEIGYWDIVSEESARKHILDGKDLPSIHGVFIPRGVDKKLVAADLRKRFGEGSILLKSEPELAAVERE